ncbi:cytochrome-c oxidase, cbb3-type subunit III [Zavarzinia sp.]|uniref:cytochrome-c oxidase, cbb3-type subunit III n=1 Tax=Zavarzinia sp. TaxID=2027920 RepID=UPI00356273AA
MASPERDPVSGYRTTGHEWDGIKELTTPIPHWWVSVFLATIAVAVIYLYLMPSFAGTTGFLPGALKWTSKGQLAEDQAAAATAQGPWRSAIMAVPLEQVEADPDLRRFAVAGGKALFNQNCAPCHGVGAGGQQGQFPSLVDDDWLWGGKIDDIRQTITHGIRNDDSDSRSSVMPTFGDNLSKGEIEQVADYVVSLSDPAADATRAAMPGAAVFRANCAACHGPSGEGSREFGAPRLNDAIWLYGRGRDAVIRQVTQPRMGMMPSFAARFDEATIRMLATYVHSLGGGER